MIADGLAITIGYLRTHAALTDLNADVRTELPADFNRPTVKVLQLNADDRSESTDHLIAYHLQFDCYAQSKGPTPGTGQASLLVRTVRAALKEMPRADLDVVVKNVTFGVCPQLPDDAWDPPRQRFSLEAWIYAHV